MLSCWVEGGRGERGEGWSLREEGGGGRIREEKRGGDRDRDRVGRGRRG